MKLLTHAGIWGVTLVFALTTAAVGHAAPKKKTPTKPVATKTKILTDPDGQRYTLKRLRKKDIRYHKRADGSVRVLPIFSTSSHEKMANICMSKSTSYPRTRRHRHLMPHHYRQQLPNPPHYHPSPWIQSIG